jgi:hypothetical protein
MLKAHQNYTSVPPLTSKSPQAQYFHNVEEYIGCLELLATTAQKLPCHPFLSFEDIATHFISSPANARVVYSVLCKPATGDFTREMWQQCYALQHGHCDAYDEKILSNGMFNVPIYLARSSGS